MRCFRNIENSELPTDGGYVAAAAAAAAAAVVRRCCCGGGGGCSCGVDGVAAAVGNGFAPALSFFCCKLPSSPFPERLKQ